MKSDEESVRLVLVRELEQGGCPTCGATIGLGLKEEPTGWKVYRVCLETASRCRTERVGAVPRASIDHFDEVIDRASVMVEQTSF